jgi:hypothetical protein
MIFAGLCGMIPGVRCGVHGVVFGQGPIYHWFAAFLNVWTREGAKMGRIGRWAREDMGNGTLCLPLDLSKGGNITGALGQYVWTGNGILSEYAMRDYNTAISFIP